jgi:hypothetical protein
MPFCPSCHREYRSGFARCSDCDIELVESLSGMVKTCPQCKLLNPDTVLHCDCGYNFETKTGGKSINPRKIPIKRKTSQRLLTASGILALLGGGSCFFAFSPPVSGEAALGWAIFGGFGGLGAFVIASILGIIGLIMNRRGR